MAEFLGISKTYYAKLENGSRPITAALEKQIKNKLYYQPDKDCVLKASFDWVILHFKTKEVARVVERILHLDLAEFTLQDYGRHHYSQYWTYGAVNLYAEIMDENQGVAIEVSGQGCRELEVLLEEQGRDWYELFDDCLVYEKDLKEKSRNEERHFNATRIDLALDEMHSDEGDYSLYNLRDKYEAGLVIMKKRRFRSLQEGKSTPAGQQENGVTLYIGSRKSDLYFRFYEKDIEQAEKLNTTAEWIRSYYGFKNRYEIVLRHDKSDAFVRDYVATNFEIGERGVGIINQNLTVYSDFKQHLDEDWYGLMNSYGAYKFETQPKKPDYTQTRRWFERNIAGVAKFLRQMDAEDYEGMLKEAEIPDRYLPFLKAERRS